MEVAPKSDLIIPQVSEYSLTKQTVLNAVKGCYGARRDVVSKLQKVIRKLTKNTKNWELQAKKLDKAGYFSSAVSSQLEDLSAMPGELALLRLKSGEFLLLRRQRHRWQIVDTDGQAVADISNDIESDIVEIVVLTIPVDPIKNDNLNSLSSLWPALRAAWAEVGLASIFINAGLLLVPLFSMLVYDKVVSNSVFETLWALTIGMAIYLVTDAAMRVVRAWSTEHIAKKLTLRGDESLWHRLLHQTDIAGGFSRFLSNYRDLSVARDFVSSSYLLAIVDLPFIFLYLLAVGLIAWPLVVVASLLVFLYVCVGYVLQRRSNKLGREAEKKTTQKLSYMGEALSSLDVLRTVPKTNFFLRRWRDLSEETTIIDGKRRITTSHSNTLSAVMMTLSTVTMLVAGAYLIEARSLSVGGLIACNILTARAMSLVASLYMVIGKWQDFQRAAERMETTLEPVENRTFTPRPAITGNITVNSLSKRYDGRPIALDSVSVAFEPGERVALLGKPGAGKTTLLRCIAGLAKADEGQVLIDGLALDDINQFDKTQWMAWKAQDPTLFAGTLEENLFVAGSEPNSDRFKKALWASGLDDELKSGRLTLGMELNERGSNLSGGQKQKVALARVLAQPSKIVLLDEPTLGLDPDSERMLAERLPQCLDKDDVLIMTTHSAIMLNVAQRVIALDGGHIVADGDREKLVRTG